jgi:hypothetical protein
MAYRIEYLKAGRQIASSQSSSKVDAEKTARENMAKRGADSYRIIDVDGGGAEVASGHVDA